MYDMGLTSSLPDALLVLAVNAATVANACDHVEHNEDVSMQSVRTAAREIRGIGVRLAIEASRDPTELYRQRLDQIEKRNVLFGEGSYDGRASVPSQPTWYQLQRVQIEHDRCYHPDVIGMPKLEQLRHYALHVAKLSGAVAEVIAGEISCQDLVARRVPDMLIFGIKLSTVTGERLSSESIADEAELGRGDVIAPTGSSFG
jgi:hypothetical protein